MLHHWNSSDLQTTTFPHQYDSIFFLIISVPIASLVPFWSDLIWCGLIWFQWFGAKSDFGNVALNAHALNRGGACHEASEEALLGPTTFEPLRLGARAIFWIRIGILVLELSVKAWRLKWECRNGHKDWWHRNWKWERERERGSSLIWKRDNLVSVLVGYSLNSLVALPLLNNKTFNNLLSNC